MTFFFTRNYNLPNAVFSMVALNNLGDLVGFYELPGGEKQSFLIDQEGLWAHLDIDSLVDINDKRQVIGMNTLYENGNYTNLGVMYAEGITDSGIVFGGISECAVFNKESYADPGDTVWVPNCMVSTALGCCHKNDEIIIVGRTENKPFIYIAGEENPIVLDAHYAAAKGINSQGIVIGGYSQINGDLITQHGWISNKDGQIAKELNFNALAINTPLSLPDLEFQVVGIGNDENATLLEKDKREYRYYDLNHCISKEMINSGWRLKKAIGVNDHGQIIVKTTFNGEEKGCFLLTPISPLINTGILPEPYLVEPVLSAPEILEVIQK